MPKNVLQVDSFLSPHQWPQQGLTPQHVGRSPYSTAANPGIEKWRFLADEWCLGSPVVDANGTIYFGSGYFYAVYPNGTLKWKFTKDWGFTDYGKSPAITEDGTIYIATRGGSALYALNSDGTEKWKRLIPEIESSMTVANNGMLYYGTISGLDARYPNGTLQWTFSTGTYVESTPAVDNQGTIYFGCHDYNIYALNPNGTLRWTYHTGAWVHGSPTIAPDGTIYCGADDDHLRAFNPDGTLKWDTNLGTGMLASPSLDKDGNLYFGTWGAKIFSVAPNGTIRWIFPLRNGDSVWGSTAAISDDGTVYIGNGIGFTSSPCGGEIIALDLNGNLKWRKTLCDALLHSSPVISSDGTVYICGSLADASEGWGYLYAFNAIQNNHPPTAPVITGPTRARIKHITQYTFQANDADNTPFHYTIDWGDGTNMTTLDCYPGLAYSETHLWNKIGTYTIQAKATDTFGLESNWTSFTVKIQRNHPFLEWLFNRFPHAFPLLQILFGYERAKK